jgi:hypothetical protein
MPIELPRGLPFAVDTWTPASALKRHRFLTHAHRDHLAGITTTSAAGAVYASRLTVLIACRIFPQVTTTTNLQLTSLFPSLFFSSQSPFLRFLEKFPSQSLDPTRSWRSSSARRYSSRTPTATSPSPHSTPTTALVRPPTPSCSPFR